MVVIGTNGWQRHLIVVTSGDDTDFANVEKALVEHVWQTNQKEFATHSSTSIIEEFSDGHQDELWQLLPTLTWHRSVLV